MAPAHALIEPIAGHGAHMTRTEGRPPKKPESALDALRGRRARASSHCYPTSRSAAAGAVGRLCGSGGSAHQRHVGDGGQRLDCVRRLAGGSGRVGPDPDIWFAALDQEPRRVIGTDTDGVDHCARPSRRMVEAWPTEGWRDSERHRFPSSPGGQSVTPPLVADVGDDGTVSDRHTFDVGDGLPAPCPVWSPDGDRWRSESAHLAHQPRGLGRGQRGLGGALGG